MIPIKPFNHNAAPPSGYFSLVGGRSERRRLALESYYVNWYHVPVKRYHVPVKLSLFQIRANYDII